MKEIMTNGVNQKKIWNTPNICSLDARKTEGDYAEQTEDYASGTRDTNPS